MRAGGDRAITRDFHGAKVNSDAGLSPSGDLNEAEALHAPPVALSHRARPEDSRSIGAFLRMPGRTLLELGRFQDAEKAVAEAQSDG